MPEIRNVPTDNLNVPLPIIPSEDFPYYKKRSRSRDIDRHHEFFLYGTEMFKTLGGQALRQSRISYVEATVHNKGRKSFHRFYNESRGPITEQGQFDLVVLGMGGYIPIQGINLWGNEPEIRDVTPEEREILTTIEPNDENVYRNIHFNHERIRPFLTTFLEQKLNNVPERTIESFLSDSRISKVRDPGLEVLQSAIQAAVSSVDPGYQDALKAGLLHPKAPSNAGEVVFKALGDEDKKDRLLHYFWQKLGRLSLLEERPPMRAQAA